MNKDNLRISDAELQLLQLLWDELPLGATEIAERVPASRKWGLATVKTLLSRLVAKGAISAEPEGRRFRYSPAIDREAVAGRQADSLVDRLFGGRVSPLVAQLAEQRDIDPADLAELEALVRELAQMSGWALHTLVATTLLMVLVLVVRRPVARLFGARAAYALWLAPAARLLLPPLPQSGAAPQYLIETSSGAASLPLASVPAGSPGQLIFFIWLGGAALFLLFQLSAHRRFMAKALRDGRRIGTDAGGPELIESEAVQSPIAAGILRKRILIPSGLGDRLGERQCRLAIAHEQLHHRRMDLHALAFSMLVLALHWFNPIAYFAHRAFRRDLEAACDAELAQDFGEAEREDYARAIIGCAAAPVPQAICTLTTIDDLKGRLTMLKWTHGRSARLAGTALAAVVVAAGLAVTAQAQTKAEPKTERVEIRVMKDASGKVIENGDRAALRAKMDQCDGEKFEVATGGAGDKQQKTKLFLCTKEGATPAETAQMLEEALQRMEKEDDVRGPAKGQMMAQVRARIAELRGR